LHGIAITYSIVQSEFSNGNLKSGSLWSQ